VPNSIPVFLLSFSLSYFEKKMSKKLVFGQIHVFAHVKHPKQMIKKLSAIFDARKTETKHEKDGKREQLQ